MECHVNITSLRPLCRDVLVAGYHNSIHVDGTCVVIRNLVVESWHIFLRSYSIYNAV
jgi:hypothetical protein